MTRLFVVPTPVVPDVAINFHGSLKKRVAPPPPAGLDTSGSGLTGSILSPHYGTLPTASHSRTTSEPILTSHTTIQTLPHVLRTLNTTQNHKRSPSGDSSTEYSPDELRKST
jgi:Arf-GAP/SH3 domain/ANK repeat/PH domain-containing protein